MGLQKPDQTKGCFEKIKMRREMFTPLPASSVRTSFDFEIFANPNFSLLRK
jgi:hypothetical protein